MSEHSPAAAEEALRQEIADSLGSPRTYVDRLLDSSPMQRLRKLWAGQPVPTDTPLSLAQAHLDVLFTTHRYQAGYGGCTCGVDYEADAREFETEFDLHQQHLHAQVSRALQG